MKPVWLELVPRLRKRHRENPSNPSTRNQLVENRPHLCCGMVAEPEPVKAASSALQAISCTGCVIPPRESTTAYECSRSARVGKWTDVVLDGMSNIVLSQATT